MGLGKTVLTVCVFLLVLLPLAGADASDARESVDDLFLENQDVVAVAVSGEGFELNCVRNDDWDTYSC